MEQKKFSDLVDHRNVGGCSACDTHEYELPFPITKEIEQFLVPFGPLRYPLDKITFVKIDNQHIGLQARLGRTQIRVKFKQDKQLRETFETQLAAYLGFMMPDVQIF